MNFKIIQFRFKTFRARFTKRQISIDHNPINVQMGEESSADYLLTMHTLKNTAQPFP